MKRPWNLALGAFLALTLAGPGMAQDRERDQDELRQRIEILMREAEELEAHGRVEEAAALRAEGEAALNRIRSGRQHADRERQAVAERAELMMRKAEELDELGRHEEADDIRHEATAMMRRLDRGEPRREPGPAPHVERLHEILDGLERGIVSLEALDRPDMADMLHRVADEVRREIEAARREPDRPEPEGEREIAIRHLEIMRTGVPALREIERPEDAELLELAIRAREVNLEGRRDDEARHIRRQAPPIEAQIELLALASKAWDRFGHERKAAALRRLAEHYHAALDRRADRAREPEREPVHDDRIRALEEQLDELRHELSALRDELREMRRPRR